MQQHTVFVAAFVLTILIAKSVGDGVGFISLEHFLSDGRLQSGESCLETKNNHHCAEMTIRMCIREDRKSGICVISDQTTIPNAGNSVDFSFFPADIRPLYNVSFPFKGIFHGYLTIVFEAGGQRIDGFATTLKAKRPNMAFKTHVNGLRDRPTQLKFSYFYNCSDGFGGNGCERKL